PGRGATGGTAPEDGPHVRSPCGPRSRVRREGWVGTTELVRDQPGRALRGAAPPRMGRPALVDGDPRRASGNEGAGRLVRRDELREDRGLGPGRLPVPPADLRERCGCSARPGRVHAVVERARWDRE